MPLFCFRKRVSAGLSAVALISSGSAALAACPQDGQPVGKLEPLDVVTATGKRTTSKVEVVDTDASREKGLDVHPQGHGAGPGACCSTSRKSIRWPSG